MANRAQEVHGKIAKLGMAVAHALRVLAQEKVKLAEGGAVCL